MGRKKTIYEMRIAMLMDEDLSIDNIIARHIELVTTPKERVVDLKIENNVPVFVTEVVREAKPAPRKAILLPKYIYLIHTIIMRCRADKCHFTKLSYKTMIEVLGKHYTDMLRTLEDMGIIGLTTAYEVGKYGRSILLRNAYILASFYLDGIFVLWSYYTLQLKIGQALIFKRRC